MKPCIKCRRLLTLSEFYRHPRMADGTLNKCKTCSRADSRSNYVKNRANYVAYEQKRSKLPHRKALAVALKSASPEKTRARTAVANAVRDGRLVPSPCRVCGRPNVQGHHADYSRPLDVDWLCYEHHRAEHGQVTTPGVDVRIRTFKAAGVA